MSDLQTVEKDATATQNWIQKHPFLTGLILGLIGGGLTRLIH